MRRLSVLAVFATAVFVSNLRAEQHSFNSNGVRIAYLLQGKGEPVVQEGESNIELMSAARQVLPKADLTVIENADHVSAVNTPEFRAAVLKFIKAHRH